MPFHLILCSNTKRLHGSINFLFFSFPNFFNNVFIDYRQIAKSPSMTSKQSIAIMKSLRSSLTSVFFLGETPLTRNNWFVIFIFRTLSPFSQSIVGRLRTIIDDPRSRERSATLQTFFAAIREFYFPPKQRFIHIYTGGDGREGGPEEVEKQRRNCRGKLYVNAIK